MNIYLELPLKFKAKGVSCRHGVPSQKYKLFCYFVIAPEPFVRKSSEKPALLLAVGKLIPAMMQLFEKSTLSAARLRVSS